MQETQSHEVYLILGHLSGKLNAPGVFREGKANLNLAHGARGPENWMMMITLIKSFAAEGQIFFVRM